jgi:putative metalloprotease
VITGVVKAGKAYMLSDEDLAKLVQEEVAEMDRQNKVCGEGSKYTKRLRRLTQGMKDADGIKLNFKVYQTTDINAFACPDGSVRVFSALMDVLRDDELLGVIGHEIGHVALRHVKSAWKDALLRSAASDLIGSQSETWAAVSDSYLGDVASAALSAKHSRYHETQADDYGYDFLKESGKNPWAMGLAFIKLKSISQQENHSKYAKLLEAFSSHPDFDERISRMREKAKKDGYNCN